MSDLKTDGGIVPVAIYVNDGTMTASELTEILGHDRHRIVNLDNDCLDFDDKTIEDDDTIVVEKVDHMDGEYVLGAMSRKNPLQKLVCLLKGGDHSKRFLDRVIVVNHK